MRVKIRIVTSKQDEQVVLECVSMTPEFEDIKNYCLAKGNYLIDFGEDAELNQINFDDIFYIEAVGKKVFAYTKDSFFEIRERLYEVEEKLNPHKFVRCSKAFLISLLKVDSIRPALNGRYCARMENGEDIIISRKYVQTVKKIILEEM